MKSYYRKQFFVLMGAMVVTILGLGLFIRAYFLLDQNKRDALKIKKEVSSYQANKKIYQEESDQLKRLSVQASALERYVLTSSTTPEFLSTLEAHAKEKNVAFTISSVETPDAGTPSARLVVHFSAEGAQENIMQFLEQLDHQTYQIAFTNFSLNRQSDTFERGKATDLSKSSQWKVDASAEILSYQ